MASDNTAIISPVAVGEEVPSTPETPRAVLSSFGRYHMYSTGQELARHQALLALFTADLRKPPLHLREHSHCLPFGFAVASRVADRFPLSQGVAASCWRLFDKWVAGQVCAPNGAGGGNIFHGFS